MYYFTCPYSKPFPFSPLENVQFADVYILNVLALSWASTTYICFFFKSNLYDQTNNRSKI